MDAKTFMNLYALSYSNECFSDCILNQRHLDERKVRLCRILRKKRIKSMDIDLFQRSIDMLSRFSDMCTVDFHIADSCVEYDNYVDDSVAIYFNERKNRVNLYFNEEVYPDKDNFDEVYFSFELEGERYLVNDSLNNIMSLVNRIIR